MSVLRTNSFAERLDLCLDKEGFPPKNKGRIQCLSELTGLTHRGAGKWLSGECTPPARKYAELAKQLNVSEQWLKTGKGAMHRDDSTAVFERTFAIEQMVPVYQESALVSKSPVLERNIQCILPYRGVFYAMLLSSSDMAPQFPVGSLLIFDRYAAVHEGDFVVVHIHDEDRILFRKITNKSGEWCLQTQATHLESLILTMPHDMMGKLIQAIVSF